MVQGSPAELKENEILVYTDKKGELKLYELGDLGFPVLASNGALEVIGCYEKKMLSDDELSDFLLPPLYTFCHYPLLISHPKGPLTLKMKNLELPIYEGKFLLKNFRGKDIIQVKDGLDRTGLCSKNLKGCRFRLDTPKFTTSGGLEVDLYSLIENIVKQNNSVNLRSHVLGDYYAPWKIQEYIKCIQSHPKDDFLSIRMKVPFTKAVTDEKILDNNFRYPYHDIEWILTYPHLVTEIRVVS